MGVAHAVKELNSFFEKKFTKRRPGKPTISIVGGVKDNLMAKVIAEVDRGINEFERQEAIDKALGGTEHDADERSADGPEL